MTLIRRRTFPQAGFALADWDAFDDFFKGVATPLARRATAVGETAKNGSYLSPPVEITEKDDMILVRAELPGVQKEDIEVTVHEDTITLKGTKKSEREKDEEGYHYSERSYGEFSRSFSLPKPVQAEGVKARFENGVLHVDIPVAEEAKPRKVEIGE